MSEFVISRDENIGIFWMVDGRVFGERTTISEASQSVNGLMDSDATHVASWSKHYQFRDHNSELAQYDYQDLPRGRVLYQMNKQRFLVYLDKALMNKKNKAAIAEYFGFAMQRADWKSDLHYTTDPAALAKLFED